MKLNLKKFEKADEISYRKYTKDKQNREEVYANLIKKARTEHLDGSAHNFIKQARNGEHTMIEEVFCTICGDIKSEKAIRSDSGHKNVKRCTWYPTVAIKANR